MWPAEHIFGSFMILVLIGLLVFGYWFWSLGLPKKEPTARQSKIWCVMYCFMAAYFGFKAWEEYSNGLSDWYIWPTCALVILICAVRDWPRPKAAQ
ncbi:hypothetical protein EH31_07880 [Erythrobacter longus]|uniref:Uncharacterized protein n=1 Tax=Erythrobacter longus TaxID=1044 RepID=A0A074MBW5_ERYLO|nr:hypothetical protein EH31_07880 [Erythrobacter longus]